MLIKLNNSTTKYVIIIPRSRIDFGIYPSKEKDKFIFYYNMDFPFGEQLIDVGFKYKIIDDYDYEEHTHVLIEKRVGISMDDIDISEEKWKKLAEKIKQKAIIEIHQYKKIENKIKDLSEGDIDDFEDLMNKFINWEEQYEERNLKHNKSFSISYIFSNLFQVWENLGEDVTVAELFNGDKPFLGHAYLYKGYLMEVHCGQGCYYLIFKNDECLFQSN